jgi:SAM-dependent methyltransferase
MMYNSKRKARAYADMIKVDPIKVFAQRPQAIKLLEPLKNRTILDMGCGDGTIARMIAARGADVVGYDTSREQIRLAKTGRAENPSDIRYFVSSPEKFTYKKKFDKALAVMVLCYSKDKKELQKIFDSTYPLLKKGGSFVVLDLNSDKIEFGKNRFGRIFTKGSDGKATIEFRIPGARPFKGAITLFSQSDLESCGRAAGFKSITRKKLKPQQKGIGVLGKSYWKEFERSSFWLWFIFKK